MTEPKQPEALRLAGLLELAPEDGVEPQTTEDAAAELRRLHTENTALQAGYAAARLEIESLQARIKAMAEEHADELMVAHLDGRMRAAQPAVAANTRAQENVALLADILNRRPAMNAGLTQAYAAWTAEVYDLMGAIAAEPANDSASATSASHGQAPAQAAPAAADFTTLGAAMRAIQQAIELIGEPADDRMRAVKRVLRGAVIVAEDSGELPAPAPTAPAQTADSVLEDAALLDWLLLHISGAEFRRIGVHYSGNASRADVDAARKQGGAT